MVTLLDLFFLISFLCITIVFLLFFVRLSYIAILFINDYLILKKKEKKQYERNNS